MFQVVSILLKNSNKCDKNEVSAPGTCKKQCLQSQHALKRQLMSLLIKCYNQHKLEVQGVAKWLMNLSKMQLE